MKDEKKYELLYKMSTEVEYYLNNGRNPKYLTELDEERHILKMLKLWSSFPYDRKPQWITDKDIKEYAREMGVW